MIAPSMLEALEAKYLQNGAEHQIEQSVEAASAPPAQAQTDNPEGNGPRAISPREFNQLVSRDDSSFNEFSEDEQQELYEALVPILFTKNVTAKFGEYSSHISMPHKGPLSNDQLMVLQGTANVLSHIIMDAGTGEFSPYSLLYHMHKKRFAPIFRSYLTEEALEALEELTPEKLAEYIAQTESNDLEDEIAAEDTAEIEVEHTPAIAAYEPIDFEALRAYAASDRSHFCRLLTGCEKADIWAIIDRHLQDIPASREKDMQRQELANIAGYLVAEASEPSIPAVNRLGHYLNSRWELPVDMQTMVRSISQRITAQSAPAADQSYYNYLAPIAKPTSITVTFGSPTLDI